MNSKKCFSLVLGVAFLSTFSLGQFVSAKSFSDVQEGNAFADAIDFVKSAGVVEGYEDGTYKPDNKINRAEFTKIIIEAISEKDAIESCLTSDKAASLSDVPADIWFAKYVCQASSLEIIGGYPDGTFRPGDDISFVEAAKIISLSFGHTSRDVESTEQWFVQYVSFLQTKAAIPMSVENYEYKISRGEMAEMIYRIKENVINKESKTFVDSDPAVVIEDGKKDEVKTDEKPVELASFDELCQEDNYSKMVSIEGYVATPSSVSCIEGHCALTIYRERGTNGYPFSGLTVDLPYGAENETSYLAEIPEDFKKDDIKVYDDKGELVDLNFKVKFIGIQNSSEEVVNQDCRIEVKKVTQ